MVIKKTNNEYMHTCSFVHRIKLQDFFPPQKKMGTVEINILSSSTPLLEICPNFD